MGLCHRDINGVSIDGSRRGVDDLLHVLPNCCLDHVERAADVGAERRARIFVKLQKPQRSEMKNPIDALQRPEAATVPRLPIT